MNQIKIENFVRERGTAFPSFRSLSEVECRQIRERIAAKLGAPGDLDPLDLVRSLSDLKGRRLQPFDLDSEFDLGRVLLEGGIEVSESVYLNWYRFDDIDQIGLAELIRYFDDIWYPSSDDLDIYDETLRWILSISHDGDVKLIEFGT